MTDPRRSGIQRVIKEFSQESLFSDYEYLFYSIHTNNLKYLSAEKFIELINNFWNDMDYNKLTMHKDFNKYSYRFNFKSRFTKLNLRIEPSFNKNILRHFLNLPENVFNTSVVYDTFPITKPTYYSGNGFANNSFYYRTLLSKQNIITNSEFTKFEIKNLILKSKNHLNKIRVVPLGADHVERSVKNYHTSDIPEIIMLGTLEPRKNHNLAYETLKIVNSHSTRYKLTFIGAESVHNHKLTNKLNENRFQWFNWHQNLNDIDISKRLENAQILLSLGDEGFGITVFESYQKGCLNIYGGNQPASELLKGNRAIRLADTSIKELSAVLQDLANDDYLGLRRALNRANMIQLPTWRNFFQEVEKVIIDTNR
jgi:glycosyltransferase involved in cell wall biosynthesis